MAQAFAVLACLRFDSPVCVDGDKCSLRCCVASRRDIRSTADRYVISRFAVTATGLGRASQSLDHTVYKSVVDSLDVLYDLLQKYSLHVGIARSYHSCGLHGFELVQTTAAEPVADSQEVIG